MASSTSFVRDFVKPLPSRSADKIDPTAAIGRLRQLKGDVHHSNLGLSQTTQSETREELTHQILASLYSQYLHSTLSQALEAETEAQWWSDIERTRWRVFWYLIQTLPTRVYDLLQATTDATGRNKWLAARPEFMVASLFPHLQQRPGLHQLRSFQNLRTRSPNTNNIRQFIQTSIQSIRDLLQTLRKISLVPLYYTLQEVSLKKHELLRIRDDRAQALGSLVLLRPEMQKFLDPEVVSSDGESDQLIHLTRSLLLALNPESIQDESYASDEPFSQLSTLAPRFQTTSLQLRTLGLSRPSRLTRLWPRLVFGPPLLIYSAYYLYSTRGTLLQFAYDAKDVVKGFVIDWCVKPLAGVLDTVKASKSDQAGWLVTKEGVQADYESLERMARSLASDHLRYTSSQLDDLSAKIRLGDLTPVLKLYEEDIKSPFKSAVGGTLLRTVFIQVQKAKVDLDQALSGIDRLMKSQELTFAFVGLSPALAIVYVIGGYLRRMIWSSSNDKGKYGGPKERERVFWAMRRAERLLVLDQSSSHAIAAGTSFNLNVATAASTQPSALTTGLLILSLTQLRTYAERYLPSSSSSPPNHDVSVTSIDGNTTSSASTSYSATSLREAFLEDLSDLQDPELGVSQKRIVVERMWRCWGGTVFGRAL
ncbi:MAG: NCA2-domain-containing protein [Lentinula lateritia]|nr:MAG: NCA2-domain-containing protein [Lentinula lateritia]